MVVNRQRSQGSFVGLRDRAAGVFTHPHLALLQPDVGGRVLSRTWCCEQVVGVNERLLVMTKLSGLMRGKLVPRNGERSEEHTSELQSRQYLVCRLLLEKKKKVHRKMYALL